MHQKFIFIFYLFKWATARHYVMSYFLELTDPHAVIKKFLIQWFLLKDLWTLQATY